MTKSEELLVLIKKHNHLCDRFNQELDDVMGKIRSICEPLGLVASRINEFENGAEVTRVYLSEKRCNANNDIDEECFETLWAEDDMTFCRR